MIEKIIEYSIRNRFIVIFGALIVAAWGVYSVINTPVDAIPDLSENQVIVFTDWMGRSPREVEDQITYPLSVNLQGLAGVKSVRSSSEFNFSMINIIFDDNIDFYFARQRVLERLTLASTFLPPDVTPYLAPDATALGQIFWYTVEGDGYDLGRLRAIQDWYIRYQLNSVEGVAQVASVGGYPIEYQIDVDPNKLRAYGVTLGELFAAVSRSNSAVGGRVIHKGNAEYLIRGVGWLGTSGDVTKDIEDIVVKVEPHRGTPIYVSNLATVAQGTQFRRSVLEKNGNEAVGAVVMMRFGENPLEVTKRIRKKIEQLQAGLPEGVRIAPFYERTRLIRGAIHTLTQILTHEMLIASIAIFLILWHFRSAFVICVTLPMSVLVSFILMRIFHVPSNIMSLSGIAISIGILVDQAIVMVENATHHLTAKFGTAKVTGDIRELVIPACRTVGRPIFFSVMIILISFAPVFALRGLDGKTFHPLAFTKSFAMIGVAIISITLVPALIPTFIKGRLRREEDNWLVRTMIEIYKPVLTWALPRRNLVLSLFAVLLVLGAGLFPLQAITGVEWRIAFLAIWSVVTVFSVYFIDGLRWQVLSLATLVVLGFLAYDFPKIGGEYMPALDEGTMLDMPITVPRASVTQVADDLKARDELLRGFPEVELVVGKAGRAETATDPAPLDMVETVMNLRPREFWPKRHMRFDEATRQIHVVLEALEAEGLVARLARETDRQTKLGQATMNAAARFDRAMREHATRRQVEYEDELATKLTRAFATQLVRRWRHAGRTLREPTKQEIDEIVTNLAGRFGRYLAAGPSEADASRLIQQIAERVVAAGAAEMSPELLRPKVGPISRAVTAVGEVLGLERQTLSSQMLEFIEARRAELWRERVRAIDDELLGRAAGTFNWFAIEQLTAGESVEGRLSASDSRGNSAAESRDATVQRSLHELRAELDGPFAKRLLLWQKSPGPRGDLVKELDSTLQVPGWGNIWTQPIINRIDMLATGVRTMIGVKVFGKDLNEIQHVSEEVAAALRNVPGAVDVVPDQSVGKGYVEITIDRRRAARYGVSVGDIQEVIEIALGGKTITMTVEGRERHPVRIRYARDWREDEDQIKNLLVSSNQMMSMPGGGATGVSSTLGGAGMAGTQPGAAASPPGTPPTMTPQAPLQIPLALVADVQIVEGPAMIKSENGLLRSYVQLNVRDRDIIGFVEHAQREVAQKVKLPPGMYLEWSGQFEHQVRANKTLQIVFPAVLVLIFIILYLTYNDLMDAGLMMMAVPEALVGGIFFLWLTRFGFLGLERTNFSTAVQIGFIACFGMATETGIIMLVYLREAIDRRGGLEKIGSLAELQQAVIEGAVHRLRPKLLTEGVAIIALAPMLFHSGVGHEVISAMAAPVLGGLLIADEVVDIFIPVRFYWVRRARWLKLHGKTEGRAE